MTRTLSPWFTSIVGPGTLPLNPQASIKAARHNFGSDRLGDQVELLPAVDHLVGNFRQVRSFDRDVNCRPRGAFCRWRLCFPFGDTLLDTRWLPARIAVLRVATVIVFLSIRRLRTCPECAPERSETFEKISTFTHFFLSPQSNRRRTEVRTARKRAPQTAGGAAQIFRTVVERTFGDRTGGLNTGAVTENDTSMAAMGRAAALRKSTLSVL